MTDNYLQISPQLLYLNLNLSLDVAAGTKSVDVTMSYELTFALLAYNRFYFFCQPPSLVLCQVDSQSVAKLHKILPVTNPSVCLKWITSAEMTGKSNIQQKHC